MSEKVFGEHLVTVMSRPSEKTIPTFMKKVIRYLNAQALDTENLFRISAKAAQMNVIKQKIDSGAIDEIDFFEYKDPHLIAGLMKLYLRELPEPLFPFQLYSKFIECATEYENASNMQRTKVSIVGNSDTDNSHTQKYVEQLASLVDEMPACNKALAEILLLFLNQVGKHSANNKMTPASLAIVFGQILLRPEVETIESMMNASKITGIMKFMIENFEEIFPKHKGRGKPGKPGMSTIGFDVNRGGGKQTEEQEKLARVKETIDDAIILVQRRLVSMGGELKETNSIDNALDIARRVRTAQKVLFPNSAIVTSLLDSSGMNRGQTFTVSSAVAERQGKRKKMEDAYVMLDDLRREFPRLSAANRFSFYGVYDGHGGNVTSSLCGQKLHSTIVSQPDFSTMNFKEAIRKGFKITDQEALACQEGQEKKDGSTAVVVLIFNNFLYLGNVGDSEALLVRVCDDGTVEGVVISEKHRPTNPKEKERIEQSGGAVFSGRVFGTLAVSRSFGDGDFKIPTSEADFVSSDPYLHQLELTKEHQFLLLGCDGLFDKINPQEAAEMITEASLEGKSMQAICDLLVDTALTRGSMDNITVVAVRFNWSD